MSRVKRSYIPHKYWVTFWRKYIIPAGYGSYNASRVIDLLPEPLVDIDGPTPPVSLNTFSLQKVLTPKI